MTAAHSTRYHDRSISRDALTMHSCEKAEESTIVTSGHHREFSITSQLCNIKIHYGQIPTHSSTGSQTNLDP